MTYPLLSAEQAAAELGLHTKTVLRHIREGRLQATRLGKAYRIVRADLDAFIGPKTGRPIRPVHVTSIIEAADLSPDDAQRMVNHLNAARIGAFDGHDRIQITTAFDQSTHSMKIVLIGSTLDTIRLIQLIDLLIEQRR